MTTLLGNELKAENVRGSVLCGEPMSAHTSFEVGGPADVFVVPDGVADVKVTLEVAARNGARIFALGAGANILVADRGIRGIVLDLRRLDYRYVSDGCIVAGAGATMSGVAEYAATRRLSGLEFVYAMPGSVGGSVWMNARCYGTSISERLLYVDFVNSSGEIERHKTKPDMFSYKVSPYQSMQGIIIEAAFSVAGGDESSIRGDMEEHRRDRSRKGHFDAPSVGSVFKNDRSFGSPTGKIIDDLDLRGHRVGSAEVSDRHANIIINTGGSNARDILSLIQYIEARVSAERGITLEREVQLVGEW